MLRLRLRLRDLIEERMYTLLTVRRSTCL